MNKILFSLILSISTLSFAQQDVCCIFSSTSGDSVQTFSRAISSMDCKKGGSYQGKTVCASVVDPDNTYCAAESTAQDRCGKCGFFWSGKECLTQNPVDKAKKELKEEEEKKKAAEKKDGVPATNASAPKTGPSSVKTTPIAPPANPSQPGPDEEQIYNRKDMSKTKGLDSVE